MHGRTCLWLVCTLTVAVAWGACAVASAQENTPLLAADPAYQFGADSYSPMSTARLPSTDTQLVSSSNLLAEEKSVASGLFSARDRFSAATASDSQPSMGAQERSAAISDSR